MPSSYNRSCICCAIRYNSCNWKLGVLYHAKLFVNDDVFPQSSKAFPKIKLTQLLQVFSRFSVISLHNVLEQDFMTAAKSPEIL